MLEETIERAAKAANEPETREPLVRTTRTPEEMLASLDDQTAQLVRASAKSIADKSTATLTRKYAALQKELAQAQRELDRRHTAQQAITSIATLLNEKNVQKCVSYCGHLYTLQIGKILKNEEKNHE